MTADPEVIHMSGTPNPMDLVCLAGLLPISTNNAPYRRTQVAETSARDVKTVYSFSGRSTMRLKPDLAALPLAALLTLPALAQMQVVISAPRGEPVTLT